MRHYIKITFLIASIFIAKEVKAQNTFPTNGKVGIGTMNPKQNLHLYSNQGAFMLLSGTAPGIIFSPTSTDSISKPSIGLATSSGQYMSTANSGDLSIRGEYNKSLIFGNLASSNSIHGIERMRIAPNGYVGIGTDSPSEKLHVNGRIYAHKSISTNSVRLSDNGGKVKLKKNDGSTTNFKTALAPSATNVGELLVNSDGNFENGTRVLGKGLVIDESVAIGGAALRDENDPFKLAVNGSILATELKIRLADDWPDYVFKSDYNLKSLKDLESEINTLGHLPNIPSAEDVKANGIQVGEMNAKLLEKIEELTLYVIDINKSIETLKAENKLLKQEIQTNKNKE